MLTKLTVTGFGPFHTVETNSSELVVRQLSAVFDKNESFCVKTRIFPVIYETASEQISETIRVTKPDILIMVGVSEGENELRLERVARNLDNSDIPDNQNAVRKNQQIIARNAPDEFRSSLPLDTYVDVLTTAGIPAQVSDDAGGYLCNHYYYLAHHNLTLSQTDCVCLIVHVPNLVNDESRFSPNSMLSVSTAAKGISLLAQQMKLYSSSFQDSTYTPSAFNQLNS